MINKETKIKNFETALALAGIFLIILILSKNILFGYLSLFIVVISLIAPRLLTPISQAYFKTTYFIGNINSKILLSLVFILILTPLAFLRKLINKNLLWLKKPNNPSYWEEKNLKFNRENLENPY